MEIVDVVRADRGSGGCELSHLSFVAKNIDVALANALRRTALSSVPNVALHATSGSGSAATDAFEFVSNTCALHNEFIAHRLSLVPLCFDEEEIETFDEARYRFVIKKKNVGGMAVVPVTSRDIEIFDDGRDDGEEARKLPMPRTFAQRIFPANRVTGEHVIITQLKPNSDDPRASGDELHVEARAFKGTARTHACFSPLSLCTYANLVDEAAAAAARRTFVAKARAEDPSTSEHDAGRRFDAIHRERHFVRNAFGEPCAFRFALESECRMRPEYVFLKAAEVLRADVSALMDEVIPLAPASVTDGGGDAVVAFRAQGFDHTVGNLVQSALYNLHVRGGAGLRFVGYAQPHPLEDAIVFKVQFAGVTEVDSARERFRAAIKDVIERVLVPFEEAARAAFSSAQAGPSRSK